MEQVLRRTLESQPEAATHWSTRDMAKATGLSQSTISRIWRAFSLAPHRAETFKLSRDPLFIDKVRDIVGLYLYDGSPSSRAMAGQFLTAGTLSILAAPPSPCEAANYLNVL